MLLRLVDSEADRLAVDVRERQHDARQGDAVGDAVVHPHQQGAARAQALEQIHVPQWLRAVKRRRDEVTDDVLQRGAVAGRGQREAMEVQPEVEARVVLPRRALTGAALDDPLAEARKVVRHTLAEHLLHTGPVQRLVEPQDRVDDHEVGRAVHMQPGRIRGGHRVAVCHGTTLGTALAAAIPRCPQVRGG